MATERLLHQRRESNGGRGKSRLRTLESIEELESDQSEPKELSKTQLLYNQLQERRKKLIGSGAGVRVSERNVTLPQLSSDEFIEEKSGVITPTTLTALRYLRTKRKWIKLRPNLKEHVEQTVLKSLQRDKKAFITQSEVVKQKENTSQKSPIRRKTHPPTKSKAKHYFWSTTPSTESMLKPRFREFAKGKVCLVKVYNQTRAAVDRQTAKIIYSAQSLTPLSKAHPVKVTNRNKYKITLESIAEDIERLRLKRFGQSGTFDPADYKRTVTKTGGLSPDVKVILSSLPESRGHQEIEVANEALQKIRSLHSSIKAGTLITSKIIKELCKTSELQSFEGNRTIIKQGHRPEAFYYIISGSLIVYATVKDEHGVRWAEFKQILRQGQTFGELAFLSGGSPQRSATIITKTDCELLKINKVTFDEILLKAKNSEFQERLNFMQQIPVLNKLQPNELYTLNGASTLECYTNDTVILGDTKTRQTHIRFVYKGECVLVRRVLLNRSTESKIKRTQLSPSYQYSLAMDEDEFMVDKRGRRLGKAGLQHEKLLTVCCLQRKDYFGTGENLTDTFVIAQGKMVCLEVPTQEFLRPSLKSILVDMTLAISDALPSTQDLLNKYRAQQKWSQYKKKVLMEVQVKKKADRWLERPYPCPDRN